ncbi:hypothetical protein ROV39_03475 [Pasteurella multocida]|uniref:DUF748 domain-containing protein n=1 Tax=Pasteurella multocida TaxID=747 RepID=A0AAW8V7E3_PASMD|nr:hypothetical protein [Pasteurella multocida]MDH7437687.1 hypothetical protein [Pasteurella multocida]MDH7440658.1 hypothetical protein [Pasteurella multocida]MDT3452296.1 hypothetical protein [Pasteurella multocida]MDY0433023.1 hypothetical protein [Pasteurella multocida]MDY0437219.1 hypothetical protein [Pasteurella multocida]
MKRKAKITLTLSSIALFLGVVAQFYTNHKIDTSLQSFPYHLRDKLTIHATEKSGNFFQRELIFTLEDGLQQKTDIISTKLTALPFAITAESTIPSALVQQLNKQLNITIDKNTINSQFSVVGDYLQSEILTEFRDLTNKAQQLEININYASKTKFMEIQSELSGFNYDAKTKLEGLKGQYVLTPIGEHQYDITGLDLKLKNADIFLLNGENTHIKLENATYNFEKNLSAQHYDSAAKFTSQKMILSNKYKKSPQENVVINQLDVALKQQAVPYQVSFYQEMEKFINNTPSLSDAILTLSNLFTNNQGINGQVSMNKLIIPEKNKPFLNFKDLRFHFNSSHENKKDSALDFEWHLGQTRVDLSAQIKTDFIVLDNLSAKTTLTQVDLEKRLAFVPFYANMSSNKENLPKDDNKLFKQALTALSDGFKEKASNQIKLKALNFGDEIQLNALEIDYQEVPSGDNQYQAVLNTSFDKLTHKKQNIELQKFKLALPMTLDKVKDIFVAYSCLSNSHYKPLCVQNLSAKTMSSFSERLWQNLVLQVNDATLDLQVDTFPNSQANAVNATLTFDLDTSKLNGTPFSPEFLNYIDLNSKISLASGLLYPNEQVLKAREDKVLWNIFKYALDREILPYFNQEGENYLSHIQIKEGQTRVNGKTLQEIAQELKQAEEAIPVDAESSNEAENPVELDAKPIVPPTKPTE